MIGAKAGVPGGHEVLARAEAVIVAYRSRDHVAALLQQWPSTLSVVVVDNSQNVDGLAHLVAEYPHARYLDGGGQGFARSANLGVSAGEREVLVFVNPDCRPTAHDLAALVSGVLDDPRALAHAATMVDDEGAVQVGVGGWEPSVRRLVVHALGLGRSWPRAGLFARPRPGEHCAVDWATGACMAVRRQTFARVGGFDDTFFVYAEDVSFGRRGRQLGLVPVLREDVQVAHSASSSGAPSREMLRLRGASFAGYLHRYHRSKAPILRSLMVVGAVLRGARALLRRERVYAGLEAAFIRGMVTRRAYVGNDEVAAARYREVVDPPAVDVLG